MLLKPAPRGLFHICSTGQRAGTIGTSIAPPIHITGQSDEPSKPMKFHSISPAAFQPLKRAIAHRTSFGSVGLRPLFRLDLVDVTVSGGTKGLRTSADAAGPPLSTHAS
jgi:hypothetical protein